ncbi:transcription factor BIM2 isoform X2 [Brachypodium distachyon]|uniref:transcription factor BIM2 isoform X2 n=1 Tax=Brachypodium distachyon TaxID=15368 RepID=UPI000234F123|nr:transcription factor BIM2 isoform X2 [Brachypodium distachyon]|eukprot:XP_014758149.1 transcription factor BIM2 isoform X2 [Brachypodium distachyon]
MGIQGNKATHDFLSLYAAAAAKDSSLHDSKPPAASQGFFLKTHDFLQPLEKPAPAASGVGRQQQPQQQTKHALPGGIGTFSISPVPGARPVVVKPEPPLVLWGQPTTTHPTAQGHNQWTLPFAGAGRVGPAPRQNRKGRGGAAFMDSGSRSSGGAGLDDDDGGLAARREVSSSLQELAVRVDGKGGSCSGSGTDQRPNTPKSKHSATEQRRRSKINDRFQILRDLLPHTDQKRDKATFLLEVIEYIRFLQEKAQKYEASFPEWNQENAKLLPWSNIYFRSSWKSAQSKGQIPEDALPDPSQFVTNGSSPGFNITGKLDDNHTTVASGAVAGTPDLAENDHMASVSCRSAETPINITNNVTSQYQPQWAGPSGVDDCAVNSSMLNDQQLTIDEGTISVSSQYSQELLNTLTHALQSSGIDLSQANISVQINLGKRAVKRSVAGQSSSSKELTDPDPSNEMVAAEELPHATKRHKSGNT